MIAAIVIIGSLALWIVPAFWIAKDAGRRGANTVGWTIGWIIFGVFALALWFIVRPPRIPVALTPLPSPIPRPVHEDGVYIDREATQRVFDALR